MTGFQETLRRLAVVPVAGSAGWSWPLPGDRPVGAPVKRPLISYDN